MAIFGGFFNLAKLKIIIPTYNYLNGFSKSIKQFSKQVNYDKNEVQLIVSDDSTNNDIYNHYNAQKSNFKNLIYRRGPQLGAVSNWNSSLEKVSSEYTMFLHHDEHVQSEYFLKEILQVLTETNTDFLVLPLIKSTKGRFNRHYPIYLKWIYIRFPTLLFICNAFGSPSLVIIRTTLMEKFDSSLKWYVDVDWYFRHLVKKPRVTLLNDPNLTVVSDLDFTGTITNKLDLKNLVSDEQNYISLKYNLPQYLFGSFLKLIRLPVKFFQVFNV